MPAKVITCTMRKTHPKAVVCSMCGGQFFPDSLKFHQKSCADKQKYIKLPCPICDKEISKAELTNHVEACKKKQNAKMKKNDQIAEKNEETSEEEFDNIVDELGRMKCSVCSRMFAQDRISIHQKICRKNNEKKCRGVFNSFKQRQFDNLIQPSEHTFKKLNMTCDNGMGEVNKKSQGLSKTKTKAKESNIKQVEKVKENVLEASSSTKKCDKKQDKSIKIDLPAGSKNEQFCTSKKKLSQKSLDKSISEARNCRASGKILPTNECSPDNTLAFPFGYNTNNVSSSSRVMQFEEQYPRQYGRNEDRQIFDSRRILPTNNTSYDYPMCNRSVYGTNR